MSAPAFDLNRRTMSVSVIAAMILLMVSFLLLGPGGRDDVYKTLWPAEALANTGHLINYNGDAVEQSSSLLHVLLLAALRVFIGGPIADLNWAMVLGFGVAGIFLAMQVAKRMGLTPSMSLAVALGGQGIYAYWAMGGLDAVLAANCWLLFAWKLGDWLEGRSWQLLGLATAFLVMVRPENGMVAFSAMGLAYLLQMIRLPKSLSKPWRKRLLLGMGIVAMMAGLLVLWRFWHGGHWLPQSARAKMGGLGWVRSRRGLRYLWVESTMHWELFVYWGTLAVLALRHLRQRLDTLTLIIFCIATTGLSFVVMSGGDWMENARFIVPYLPFLILGLFSTFERIAVKGKELARMSFAFLCICSLVNVANNHNTGYPSILAPSIGRYRIGTNTAYSEAHNRIHLRDLYPCEFLIHEHDRIYAMKGKKVEILSQQAGYMAFYLARQRFGQFHFVDLVGLSTPDFTDCDVTRDRGRFPGGLNMDLMYLLGDFDQISSKCAIAKPDIIFGLDEDDGRILQFLNAHGYATVYSQTGIMRHGFFQDAGMEISGNEFIVVMSRWKGNEPPIQIKLQDI